MRILELPWPEGPSWVYNIALSGEVYEISAQWNGRVGRWYIDIRQPNGEPILLGHAVVTDWPFFEGRPELEGRPPGELYVIDEVGVKQDILLDLGDGHVLALDDDTLLSIGETFFEGPGRFSFVRERRPARFFYAERGE